ncbi:peptide chain release factor N(5)-glutamine methyltransferase [Ideonella sp. 4Y16]|uniref:Release factor glutamine methyltransferase n=1 Tax=Ideonella alba TaxID=2824118 RepID=A0A941BCU1_9BURK|nr:peptide chain release factor N(5)-glutamine methyltransferase [Ideonella alba]MBQ0932295.1 peptide chain release factor N(5)-glutamine methyltransferase [Ideonella alba]MBQ0944445.1 peptide chain release factor N(5)-glutamine methyltransferase [Ideonella alba]
MSTTVAQALQDARTAGLDRVDAFVLLGALLQRKRGWLIAHDEARLDTAQAARWADWCRRRAAGEPVAYLLGEREFHGLRLAVSPAVLIPRPDTEVLVDWALERLAATALPAPRVLDLGTGSGAIALAVKHRHPAVRLTAVDASAAALTQARANGDQLGLDVDWRLGDWWQGLAGQRFDLVLSNPPYIAQDDPHLQALAHEPLSALASGADGLDDIRCLLAGAPDHLAPGAWLLLEHGWDQAPTVRALLSHHGFTEVQSRQDLAGHARCSGGRWPATD